MAEDLPGPPTSSAGDAAPPSLRALTELALAFRDARDWAQFHQPKDLALALGIEVGELAELLLWKRPEAIEAALEEPAFRARLAEELADVQLFLLYLAERCEVDLDAAVRRKLVLNEQRYPVERARGRATKHDQL